MRIVDYREFGPAASVLKMHETDKPVAGPGQVLVKTLLSPIHNHDLWTIAGNYGYKPELPARAGSEAVGMIESVGQGVDAALKGRRVAVAGAPGTWGEYFLASAGGVVPVPDAIGDEAAAQLIAMPFSAIALLETLPAKSGDWIVQTAANGAVGKILAVLAKARGIHTINLVRRDEAVDELEALGMDNVISTASKGWQQKAKNLLGEKGARAAVDSVGGALGEDLIDLLGYKGVLSIFGSATGAPLALSSGTIIFKQLSITGFWGAKVIAEMPDANKARLIGELVKLAANGTLDLTVGGTYGLADIAAAIVAAQTPGRAGKIMIKP